MPADIALVGGNVITLDTGRPRAEAVLVVEGRVALVGSDADIRSTRPAGCEVVELRGRTVLPGFIDTHVHLMATGLADVALAIDDCLSLAEIEARLRAEPPTRSIRLGIGLDPERLRERRYPSRGELDESSPDRPVCLVRRDMHSAALNSAALALTGLKPGSSGVDLDAAGQPTGVVRGDSWLRASVTLFGLIDHATWQAALRAGLDRARRVGVTTVHAMEGGFTGADADVDTVLDYAVANEHTPAPGVRIVPWWQTTDVGLAAGRGLPRIGGCILLDGSFGSHTAALEQPYHDDPTTNGRLYRSDEELESFIFEAHRRGMQIAVHAIGDRAIAQALRAFGKALAQHPRADHRHRIEHFMLPTNDQMLAAARLGLHAGVQPTFHRQWGGPTGMYSQRVGPSRFHRLLPLRSMVDAGMRLAGGSDSAVTPLDPLMGIHAAVNDTPAEQRLTPLEAVRLYTVDAARVGFEEREKGTIVVGKVADLVILGADPLRIPPSEIVHIPVEMTLVDGHVLGS